MIDLEPIKARLEAATPGKWVCGQGDIHIYRGRKSICNLWADVGHIIDFPNADNNAAFIAAAHNTDIAALIAEVERLRQDLIDERGWRSKYDQNSAMIGMTLAPIRQRRDTGEPLRSDHAEVADLATEVERLRQTCRDIYDLATLKIGNGSTSRRVAKIADLAWATFAEAG